MRNQIKTLGWALAALLVLAADASYGACNYTLSPASRNHGYGNTNNSFMVTTSETNCTWTPTSDVVWITVQPGWGGVGSNVVNYVIAANTNTIGRTGTVTVVSQTFTVRQDPAPCNYSLFPKSTTHGYAGASSSFDVNVASGCSWTATTSNFWINLTGIISSNATATVPYTVSANTTPLWRTGYVNVAAQAYVIAQRPAPCIYELSPTNTTRGYSGASGAVNVAISSGNNCTWFVDNTNTWITITNVTTTSFGYIVASNSSSISRTGTLSVWDQTFLVAQGGAPCNGGISPTSTSPGAEPVTRVVSVAIAGSCPWYVTNNNSWITVLPMSANGSDTVSVMIGGNTNSLGRTGTVSIAGQTYTVRQDGAVCNYHLSATNRPHGYAATSSSVTVFTLSVCGWTVNNTNSWLTFAATNGFGDSNITYYVAANAGATDRSGYVIIGDQQLLVTQSGIGCAANLSPTTRSHGYPATNNFLTLTIGASCSWNAITSNAWINILNPSGSGVTQILYTVTANTVGIPRTGYINVGDDYVTLTQAGAPCTNGLSTNAATHSAVQEIGSVAVVSTVGCSLTITNTNSWITIIAGEGDTSGSTNVIYQVDTNLTGSARSGVVVIGNRNFTVTQNGVTCTYKLSPAQRGHGPSAVVDTLKITVSNPCPWSVINTNPWITILTNASGAGSNIITYAVDANTLSPFERIGVLVVANQSCIITQRGITCSYSISPNSRAHGFGIASNFFSITTTNGCPWAASTTNSWITITNGFSGTNTGDIGYTIETNTNLTERIGIIIADSQTFTITQRAALCTFSLSPTSRNHGYSQTNNSIFVNTAPGCGWLVDNTNSWITIQSGASGTGTGTVTYVINSNLDSTPRTGSFLVADRTFVITQAQYLCTFKLSPTNRQHGFGQKTDTANVTAGPTCSWSVNNTNDWIIINTTTATNFTYTVYPNYGTSSRTGLVFVADDTLTITQLAATNGLAIESLQLGGAGDVTLKLNGGPPGIWEIHGSSNLVSWDRVGFATNVTGKVDFNIPPSGATNRFYRAFLP